MSSTHRRKIARALAKATGMTYQQALAAVVTAAENGLLPHALDDTGIADAAELLAAHHTSAALTSAAAPSTPSALDDIDLLAAFGISRHGREQLAAALTRPHGLVVFAGYTGTGKTTALYDTLTHLAATGRRVASVEPLIERHLDHPNLTQHHVDVVGDRPGLEIAAAVQFVRRTDPDVLAVDELRHEDVATVVVDAALTGTLVLSTMHAHTPEAVVQRLARTIAPGVLAEALSCVVVLSRLSVGYRATVTTITEEMRETIRRSADRPPTTVVTGRTGSGKASGVAAALTGGGCAEAGTLVGTTSGKPSPAHLANHRIRHTFVTPEAGHLLITGPTGSGKTVITREAMCLHRSRGDRILLIDTVRGGADYDGLADEVATTTDAAFAMLTRLVTDERRTLLVIEELTVAIPPPAEGERTTNGLLAGMSPTEETLRRIFADFTPERGRIVATTQRGLIEDRDKNLQPLGWVSGFDTNVVLGPNASFFRALPTPQGHEPLSRGWAYVEHADGRLEEVNLWGEEKDRPFSGTDRERVRTGLRRLAAMMRTGMSPSPALATLAQTMTGEAERVFVRLSQAPSLSKGAAREPHVFEPWTIAMLETGETSGALHEAVKAIVEVY